MEVALCFLSFKRLPLINAYTLLLPLKVEGYYYNLLRYDAGLGLGLMDFQAPTFAKNGGEVGTVSRVFV